MVVQPYAVMYICLNLFSFYGLTLVFKRCIYRVVWRELGSEWSRRRKIVISKNKQPKMGEIRQKAVMKTSRIMQVNMFCLYIVFL